MFASICRHALRKLFVRCAREGDASILPTFALALVPVMGMVGAAVDYSRAGSVRTGLQAALDAAILAGARDGTANWINVALSNFNANMQSKGSSVSTPTFVHNEDGSYSGSVTASLSTAFMGILGTSSMPLTAQTK